MEDSATSFDELVSYCTPSKATSHVIVENTSSFHVTMVRFYFSFSGYPGYAFIDRNGIYKEGVIKRVSDIKDRSDLAAMVK